MFKPSTGPEEEDAHGKNLDAIVSVHRRKCMRNQSAVRCVEVYTTPSAAKIDSESIGRQRSHCTAS